MRKRKKLKGFSHIHSICGKYAAPEFCRGVHKGTPSSHVSFPFLPCRGGSRGAMEGKSGCIYCKLLHCSYRRMSKDPRHTTTKHHTGHRPKLKQRFFLYSHLLQVNVSSPASHHGGFRFTSLGWGNLYNPEAKQAFPRWYVNASCPCSKRKLWKTW